MYSQPASIHVKTISKHAYRQFPLSDVFPIVNKTINGADASDTPNYLASSGSLFPALLRDNLLARHSLPLNPSPPYPSICYRKEGRQRCTGSLDPSAPTSAVRASTPTRATSSTLSRPHSSHSPLLTIGVEDHKSVFLLSPHHPKEQL